MDRKEFKKEKAYVKPTIEVIRGNIKGQMLASSPAVQPGITVEPPEEDVDEEISSAKKFNVWSEWED